MAVLCNNVIAGASIAEEAAGGGAYQIERSLRFPNSGYLKKANTNFTGEGNRRIWTWAGWVKKCGVSDQVLWEADNGTASFITRIQLDSESNLSFLEITDGSVTSSLKTSSLLRDHDAWYHIVVALDTTKSISADRVKIYINGERETVFSTETYPTQHLETRVNSLASHAIGRQDTTSNKFLDGYLADVYFIDGLQLNPSAFGSFDLMGVWNPKALALPAPNANKTWSSVGTWTKVSDGSTLTFHANGALTKGFDQSLTSGVYPAVNTDYVDMQWTIPSADQPALTNSLRLYASFTNYNRIIEVHTDAGVGYTYHAGASSGWTTAAWLTLNVPKGSTKLQKLVFPMGGVTACFDWYAMEIDGIQLIDGQIDPTTRSNPNNGIEWKNADYNSGGDSNNYYKIFDGAMGDWMNLTNAASPYTFTPPTGIPITTLRLFIENDTTYTVSLNGGSAVSYPTPSLGLYPVDLTDHGSITTLTSIALTSASGGSGMAVRGIEINGHFLIDDAVDNSYHFKFNDITRNSALGKDSLNGKIADATGGLPIYNTTDDFGEVKGSGNRTDSDSGNLDLAIAGDAFTDSSGNSVTVTASGAVISTDQSRFYGSSIFFDGSNDHITTAGSLWSANGNQTFECWIWANNITSASGHVLFDTGGSGQLLIQENSSVKRITFHPSDGNYSRSEDTIPEDEWVHIAFTQTSNTRTIFINGKKVTSYAATAGNAQTAAWNTPTGTFRIGHESANTRDYFDGYMQDIRVYDKVKYTDNFKPPTRNDFTVNGITEAATHPNDGRDWEADGTTNNSWSNLAKAFNSTQYSGGTPDGAVAAGNHSVSYSYPVSKVTKIRLNIFLSSNQSGASNIVKINGTDVSGSLNGTTDTWQTTDVTGSFTNFHKIELANYHIYLGGIEINDVWLLDNTGTPARGVDSVVDTPTNYGEHSDPPVGGEIRGNYCTLSRVNKHTNCTLSEGNLKVVNAANANRSGSATFGMPSGKWYWEVEILDTHTANQFGVHVDGRIVQSENYFEYSGWCLQGNGSVYGSTNPSPTQPSFGNFAKGDIFGVALDIDSGKLWFSKNGTYPNSGNPATGANAIWASNVTPASGASGSGKGSVLVPGYSVNGSGSGFSFNFGQHEFNYAVPAGFKTLCTQNLPDTFSGDELNNPSKYFDILTYEGTGSDQDIKGLDFQPDLVWIKNREDGNQNNSVHDAVRGTTKPIYTDSQDAETTQTSNIELKAFNSDGFKVSDNGRTNNSGEGHVGWCWDAGTAASGANNNGSMNISAGDQWVNTTAGFSISKYTSTGSSDDTIGHGLNAKPDLILIKNIDSGTKSWAVYHSAIGATLHMKLDTNSASVDDAEYWHDTEPTNTVFSIGNWSAVNGTNNDHIAYCWTAVPGYSAFGYYTGNGAAQGPFNNIGFKPRWVLIKRDGTAYWQIHDTKRSTYNGLTKNLFPNSAGAETSDYPLDILSNGFLTRDAGGNIQYYNSSGDKIVWAAFAEHPFKIARAR